MGVCVCVGVCIEVKVAQLYPTLCDPWSIQSMEFSRPEYWSGQPFPFPGDLLNPGIETSSPALQADSLLAEPPGKPSVCVWLGGSVFGSPLCVCVCIWVPKKFLQVLSENKRPVFHFHQELY